MSKKEKVFSVFAKVALILNTITMIFAIVNFATSFLSAIPYVGYMITAFKTPVFGAIDSLFVPGLVFTILGFFGDKVTAKKALTRLILGVVFTVLAVVVTIIATVAFGVIIAALAAIFNFASSSSYTAYLFML